MCAPKPPLKNPSQHILFKFPRPAAPPSALALVTSAAFASKSPEKKLSRSLQHKHGHFSDDTFIFLKQILIRLPVRTHQITRTAYCGRPPASVQKAAWRLLSCWTQLKLHQNSCSFRSLRVHPKSRQNNLSVCCRSDH